MATGSTGAAPSPGASTADSSASTASTASSATTTSVDQGSAASTPAASGEPPRERWDDILSNTRTKTRSEVEAEYRQKYGWADQFQSDPYSFVDTWVDQLAAHPQYQAQIYAKAARMLQSRRGAAQPQQVAEEPQPDVPIVDGHGNVTGQTYSAKQLKQWRDWDWAQKQSTLDQRLQPLEEMRTTLEQHAVQQQVQQQADRHATETLTELRRDPHFKAHESKVKKALMDHPEWGDNVHRAYHHVLQTDILPSFTRNAESNVLGQLKTQAAGGTVNPGQNAPTQAPKFKDFGDALRYFSEHPDEAAVMAKR